MKLVWRVWQQVEKLFGPTIIGILLLSSFFSFCYGLAETLSDGKCTYRSLAHYFPVRVVVCELFEHRF